MNGSRFKKRQPGNLVGDDLLVGGWATPLKNMKVNRDDYFPNISGKIKNGNQTTNQFIREEFT